MGQEVHPIEKFTGAIHVYGGDFFSTARSEWDPQALSERSIRWQERADTQAL